VPSNSDINFLLGYLYFQKSQFQDAENYLVNATKADLHHVQALTLLGDYASSGKTTKDLQKFLNKRWRRSPKTGLPITCSPMHI